MNTQSMSASRILGLVAWLCLLSLSSSIVSAGGPGILATTNLLKDNATDGLIVKFRDKQATQAVSINSIQLQSLSATAGVNLTHFRAMSGNAQVMKLPQRLPLAEVEAIARRLRSDPQVEYAEPDRRMHVLVFPDDPQYANQWHYHSYAAQAPYAAVAGGANLPGAWDITTGSASIVAAVIDTGLAPHADIDSNILDGVGKVVPGYDFISNTSIANDSGGRDNNPTDPGDWIANGECGNTGSLIPSSWHGTHVAGTIGALSNNTSGVAGINWVSKILPVRVLGKCGGSESDVIDGMRWAAGLAVTGVTTNPNPAKVLNLSLGGDGACGVAQQAAIDEIVNAGAVVVVAAGNSNVDLAVSPESPASCANVISVAAINPAGGRADYSNYGTTVEIAAPGGEQSFANDPNGVLSTLNTGTTTRVASPGGDTYIYYEGTSMAAPHITGIVSLMYSVNPALTPALVLSTLQSTARAFPSGTASDCTTSICGAGIVDATAVIAATAAMTIVTVSASDADAAEAGLNPGTFSITRVGDTASALTVNYTIGGTATSGSDFTAVSGSVIIASGSSTATVTITPVDDTTYDGAETVILTLSPDAAYEIGASVSATVTIADDDGIVTVTATDAAAAEAGLNPGTFTISRTGATTLALTVNYTMSGTAANATDYTSLSGSVIIAPGSSTATVTLTPIDDTGYEGSQTAIMTLTANPATYAVGSPASATVTIADNESPPPSSGGGGGGGCFIATAAYGTPMAEDVRYLRAFRDEYLQTNDAGRWFVKQYYEHSPAFADYLREHDGLRAVVRSALSPLVSVSKALVSGESLAAQTKDRP